MSSLRSIQNINRNLLELSWRRNSLYGVHNKKENMKETQDFISCKLQLIKSFLFSKAKSK